MKLPASQLDATELPHRHCLTAGFYDAKGHARAIPDNSAGSRQPIRGLVVHAPVTLATTTSRAQPQAGLPA